MPFLEQLTPSARERFREEAARGGRKGSRIAKRQAAQRSWAKGGALHAMMDARRKKSFGCPCGKEHKLPADYYDGMHKQRMEFDCPCGRQFTILRGHATLLKLKPK